MNWGQEVRGVGSGKQPEQQPSSSHLCPPTRLATGAQQLGEVEPGGPHPPPLQACTRAPRHPLPLALVPVGPSITATFHLPTSAGKERQSLWLASMRSNPTQLLKQPPWKSRNQDLPRCCEACKKFSSVVSASGVLCIPATWKIKGCPCWKR